VPGLTPVMTAWAPMLIVATEGSSHLPLAPPMEASSPTFSSSRVGASWAAAGIAPSVKAARAMKAATMRLRRASHRRGGRSTGPARGAAR
jgi:hypothetical protein